MNIANNLKQIKSKLPKHVTLVAVTKTKSVQTILEAYDAGQRIFGENKIQEMVDKFETLPKDIKWHMIGHLQRNKVKYMAHFVDLIHGVDSFKTLKEINKQALKQDRVINCLLQAKIAKEETKFGMSFNEIKDLLSSDAVKDLTHIHITGLMGMSTFTADIKQIRNEFSNLNTFFDQLKIKHPTLQTLSMGMSGDYPIAVANGSTMVRVGSAIFGSR